MNNKLTNYRNRYLIIIGGALICFAFISYEITVNQSLYFDTVIREWAYSLRGPVQNKILIFITRFGNKETYIIFGVLLLIFNKTRKDYGVPFAVTALSSTVIYKIVKMVFHRPRPDMAVRIITQGGYSFPSGHAMNGLVCYGMLIYLIRKNMTNKKAADRLTFILMLLPIIIGCSRVYVGVHFPTDILGGWSLGTAVLFAAIIITERIQEKKNDI